MHSCNEGDGDRTLDSNRRRYLATCLTSLDAIKGHRIGMRLRLVSERAQGILVLYGRRLTTEGDFLWRPKLDIDIKTFKWLARRRWECRND